MIDDETNEKCSKNEESFDTIESNKNDLNKLNCDDNNSNNNNNLTQHVQQQQQISQYQQHRQQINSPIENRYIIDKDGLMLALKYFTSSTLTMRLSGIAQINNYISMFNEYLQAENTISSLRHSEGEQFVNWILSNKIIEHIFGPNLHVEVIKQSQIILNFVVAHLTPEQIDVIWSASQLKHCSKQVFDILMPLIKNMNVPAVLHLYNLLKNLDIKEHTEQTLCLASYLLKFIWAKSFNINEPTLINQHNKNDIENVLKKGYINMLCVNPNYEFLKEVSDDSSASASMVEDSSDEEEVTTCFLRDQEQLISNREQQSISVTENDPTGDSVSSCTSVEEENKQDLVTKNPIDELFKTTRANELSTKQQLKSHRQAFEQTTRQQELSQVTTHQLPIHQQTFEPHQSALTVDYLEKKCSLQLDSDSESEYELSDYKNMFLRKERVQRSQRDKFDCFKKTHHHLKIADEEDEEMFESDDEVARADDRLLSRLIKFKNCEKTPKNLIQQGTGDSNISDSNSSQFSEKNMADFDGEESETSPNCSDQDLRNSRTSSNRFRQTTNYITEISASPSIRKNNYIENSLINLAHLQNTSNSNNNQTNTSSSINSLLNENSNSYENEIAAELVKFSLENVCKPGQTLLWDLLQDDSIRYLSGDLALNCEKILFNLICWLSDKRLRMKFIEGCMDNISQNRSVIISLRLLPKLLMSFDQRGIKSEIHALTMMVEQERNLLNNFFSNLVQYTEMYKHYTRLKHTEEQEKETFSSSSDIYEQPLKIRKISELQDKSNSSSSCSNVNSNKTQSSQQIQSSSDTNSQQQSIDGALSVNFEQTSCEFFSNMLYSHSEEVQTRLQFLSIIFSGTCSPEAFELSREQIDILWYCLAYDLECRDELFNWLLNQVRTKEQHALSNEMLEYILEKKMPTLTAESYTTVALDLLQILLNNIFIKKQQELFINRKMIMDQALNNQKNQLETKSSSNQQQNLINSLSKSQIDQLNNTDNDQWKIASIAIRQLWNIALKAINTDVSVAAIRNLNNYYVHLQSAKTLDKEEEFIKQCMNYLTSASRSLREDEEKHLTVIQRALVLLKTHLESFRCRYSFHFRLMQLNGDQTITSHRMKLNEPLPQKKLIKIVCQISSLNEKFIFDMYNSDYIGELRAEVTNRWSKLINNFKANNPDLVVNKKINLNFDGQVRLLSQGQEITYNLDEKTLGEMGFKDGQVVYLTTGAIKQIRRKDTIETKLPDPPKNKLPFILLLDPVYFDQLFDLLQQLASMRETFSAGKAQLLSRRVLEIINLLPTSPNLMKCFKNICLIKKDEVNCNKESSSLPSLNSLLDPKSPQKLIYSLQIVDYLQKAKDEDINADGKHCWLKYFVDYGGLNHLFDIFISGVLQQGESNNSWNEWKQECLAILLQLIYQIGVNNSLNDINQDNTSITVEQKPICSQEPKNTGQTSSLVMNSTKRRKLNRPDDRQLVVQQFNHQLLSMLNDVDQVLRVLLTILSETCSASKSENVYYQTGFWGRSQIVHHTFTFLTSWLFSDPSIHINLFNFSVFEDLLKMLVLEDLDPLVRKEVCSCLHRLCLGNSKGSKIGFLFIPHLLNILLTFLPIAQSMKPSFKNNSHEEICYIEKESYGPGCRDYFWLINGLVDSLDADMIGSEENKVDLEKLCVYLASAIENHEIRETRNLSVEDESLKGLLGLMAVSLKHNLAYKKSDDCKTFLYIIFDCLFAHPNSKDRNLPKCKQKPTRTAAFDLLIEIIKGCEENQMILIKLLYKQHTSSSHNTYVWDYWPHEDCRSECGYVGLINLGATCYMASCVQHLFMFPKVRKVILSAKVSKNIKNSAILYELQKMFAFLLESERKAYNPKNFCKVYTMDNQPLNTGEQKDMTEFFNDLITKLEEMSGELKNTLRELFAGTLSNNVVSLDCPHISRTTEEFYTLRCKVADMRNLYDSLDELTVKDTLEGDNMYTCSQCGKKVRAEKRACIKKLPEILCLNTLRYTFNMVTMTKEKVNTHFSFPMRIDLSPYLEENLIRNDDKQQHTKKTSTNQETFSGNNDLSDNQSTTSSSQPENPSRKRSKDESVNNSIPTNLNEQTESNQYELIGVTVHTGTADGGHYYCFIREPDSSKGKDKWYIFNDAEVHSFDPNQLASECFGGEMTSKTYDSVNDKFMDFAIEKTNSAYMLFYKRISKTDLWPGSSSSKSDLSESQNSTQSIKSSIHLNKLINNKQQSEYVYEIPKELSDWIWEDNIQFIKDKYIFEHNYFSFMWQVCASIPQTISNSQNILLPCAQLATAFVIETLIHSKEKPTIANWIELLTKQFNASLSACQWLIDHIAENYLHWPVQILLKCPNQMVRQLFQRLCVHVITELKKSQQNLYLKSYDSNLEEQSIDSNLDEESSSSSNELKLSSDQTVQSHQSTSISSVVKLESMQNIESIDNLLPNYGKLSCVTRLIRKLLLLIKCNNQLVRPHLKHLTEYFNLLYEFTKMGEIEVEFMLKMEAISIIVQFYLNHCKANGEILEVISDDEDLSEFDDDQNQQLEGPNCGPSTSNSSSNFSFYRNSQLIGLAQSFKELQQEKYTKPASLDKMISFVAFLVEKSRQANGKLCISNNDMEALVGKNFAFLHRQIRDNINLRQTFNLICTLCLNNEKMSTSIINMILTSINRQPEISQPFFIILSMLVDLSNSGGNHQASATQQQQQQQHQQQQQQQQQQQTISTNSSSNSQQQQQQQSIPSSIHSFSNNIYPKIFEIAEQNPLHTLEWLTAQVPRNANLHDIILKDLSKWMECFLIGHNNQRVRQATAYLITSLVPNNIFRQTYKSTKTLILQNKENLELTDEATQIVRKIFSCLLGLLKTARQYVEIQQHGTSKLTSYFALMYYCLLSKKEKLMLVPYFNDLWNLFQPKLSEPPIPINHNKQALLYFWHQACIDCPENVQCIIQNSQVTKNIAFNYILADHDDQEVVLFNRIMLPSYYGLLSLCCVQSRAFTRQLSQHQNMGWAFKNITPYYTQYQNAANELFKLMRLFVTVFPDSTEEELIDIRRFKRDTISLYLNSIDPRSCWTTTITAFTILLEDDEDRIYAILNNAIVSLFQSFNILFMMFHEATACHITNEIVDILRIISSLLSTLYKNLDQPKLQEYYSKWKDHSEMIKKPIHLLNNFTPADVRSACMNLLIELIQLFPKECIPVTVQILGLGHLTFQEQFSTFQPGPYFPRLGQHTNLSKSSLRPNRPVFQMHFHPKILQSPFGKDRAYDNNLKDYYLPYYNFIAKMCKIANENHIISQELVGFCSMVALESLTMRMTIFPKLWFELVNSGNGDDFINMLCNSCNYFKEYINLILMQEQDFLQYDVVFDLIKHCLFKINPPLVTPQWISRLISIDCSINLNLDDGNLLKKYIEILGYLRSLLVVFSNESTLQLLDDEHKTILINLRNKLQNFSFESSSSSSDLEMPQKRKRPNNEVDEDSSIVSSNKQITAIKKSENNSSAKNEENSNSLQVTKNDLKSIVAKTMNDLVNYLNLIIPVEKF